MTRILLVDDDAVTLEAYRSRLSNSGLEVSSARDGIAALKQLHDLRPDLVVLDLMMPKFSGFEVLRYIRSEPELKHMSVVVLSNYYSEDPEHLAAMSEANVTLYKSDCTPTLLLDTVQHLLHRGPVPLPSRAARAPARRISKDFARQALLTLATMRQLNDAFVQSEPGQPQNLRLYDFYQKAHAFTGAAATAGHEEMAVLASAFEAFLSELLQKPTLILPSTLQTIAYTLEFFRVLLAEADTIETVRWETSKALVIDDDPISTHALIAALRKTKLGAFGLHDPVQALESLRQDSYCLILLDIEMPGMNGFELCEQIRKLPGYARTPVIFVTGHAEFDNRIHSVLSGGNDLIAKPVFAIELAVKAITHLLRSRLPERWDAQ
jgi:CheY-like chemotaxis protein